MDVIGPLLGVTIGLIAAATLLDLACRINAITAALPDRGRRLTFAATVYVGLVGVGAQGLASASRQGWPDGAVYGVLLAVQPMLVGALCGALLLTLGALSGRVRRTG